MQKSLLVIFAVSATQAQIRKRRPYLLLGVVTSLDSVGVDVVVVEIILQFAYRIEKQA